MGLFSPPQVAALRLRERRLFHRSRTLREVAAFVRTTLLGGDAPDLAHLAFYQEVSVGPVQRDEALILHALVRSIRPRTIVELGFARGDSAFNFLRALGPEGRLYSFDIEAACADIARQRFGSDPRFVLRIRSQERLTAEDIDGRVVDFVFLDASHELGLNQATFRRLLPLMAHDAIVAIHDTGTIGRAVMPPGSWALGVSEGWVKGGYEHQPSEREFANWLLEQHAEFSQLHLHTTSTIRHGLTLLQRSAPLPRPAPQ